MDNQEKQRIGQVAYEAYCEFSSRRSPVSGARLPGWEVLD